MNSPRCMLGPVTSQAYAVVMTSCWLLQSLYTLPAWRHDARPITVRAPVCYVHCTVRWRVYGSRAASFKRSLLSVDVTVSFQFHSLPATSMLNISETKRFRCPCTIGSLEESVYGASIGGVIDDVTWLWRHTRDVHNIQSRRIRKLGPRSTIRVDPLSEHYRRTLC